MGRTLSRINLTFYWHCISIHPTNESQLVALLILSVFRQWTSTCFGHVCSPSSGGIRCVCVCVYIYIYIYIEISRVVFFSWLSVGRVFITRTIYRLGLRTRKLSDSNSIFFDVLLTVHLSIFISVIKQLDAQNFCFIVSLFHASTCFEHHMLIIRRSKLHYTASSIITPIGVMILEAV